MAEPRKSRITPADHAIARRIAAIRATRTDTNQTELGEKAGHGQSWWSGIETARHRPAASDVGSIARALNCDVRYLIYGEEEADKDIAAFDAQITGMGRRLDQRGRDVVLAVARQQVAELEEAMRQLAAASTPEPTPIEAPDQLETGREAPAPPATPRRRATQ